MPMVTRGFIHESLSGPQREFFPQSHFVFFSRTFTINSSRGLLYSCTQNLPPPKKIQLTTRTKKPFFVTFFFRISVAAYTSFDSFVDFFNHTIPGPWHFGDDHPIGIFPRKRAIELDPLGHDASPMVKGAGRWGRGSWLFELVKLTWPMAKL